MTRDERFMSLAAAEAEKALAEGEIPVGAVVVKGDEVMGVGHNRRENDRNPLGHAELAAITEASKKLGDWRLDGCEMFVTLEPCAMCSGAIASCRIRRVVFGAFDSAAGYCISREDLHRFAGARGIEVLGGVRQSECEKLLADFFGKKRS